MSVNSADAPLTVLAIEGDGRIAGLREQLAPDLALAGADSASAAVEALMQRLPDAMFLDVALAGAEIGEWLARLHAAAPTAPVIAVAAAADAALAAVQAGADGFLIPPPEERGAAALAEAVRTATRRATAGRCRRRAENGGPLRLDLSFVYGDDGQPAATVAVVESGERRRGGERMRLAAKVFESSTEGIIVTDADEVIIRVNPAFTELTGYTADEVVGRRPSLLQSGRHDRAFYDRMREALRTTGKWQGEIWNRRKDGQVIVEWLNIGSVRNARGELTNYVAVFSDITSRKRHEERLSYQLNHDPLTGLPNRSLLQERLDRALARARRHMRPVAVLFLDLDQFKQANDRYGHLVGDRLLQQVAERLKESTRQGDTVARLSGDEFVILLEEVADFGDSAIVAQKILRLMEAPFGVDGRDICVTASIGISHYPDDGDDADSLITAADMAMYRAKKRGKNCYCFSSDGLDQQAVERLALQNGLADALDRGEFRLLFQPIYDLASGRMVWVEALLRWQHPVAGVMLPAQFLPLAEESGVIVTLGGWVVAEACRQLRAWRDAGHVDFGVSVNVSPQQLAQPAFAPTVAAALAAEALPPQALQIEVTEKAAVGRDLREVMAELKTLGVRLALDDFGIGSSSFAQMRRLPLDALKIDRSLILDITTDSDDARIITAITSIAHSAQMKVVVQGVERRDQLAFVRRCGCDLAQGQLLGPPMPPNELTQILGEAAPLAM